MNVTLTKREAEILSLAITHSRRQIAKQLFISKRTVDFHLSNVYDKLLIGNKHRAYKRAVELGLIKPTGVKS